MIYGYARAAGDNYAESIERQRTQLIKAGAKKKKKVYCESCSGMKKDRLVTNTLLNTMKSGDTLLVVSTDRLTRNAKDVMYFVTTFWEKGIKIRFLENSDIFEGIWELNNIV